MSVFWFVDLKTGGDFVEAGRALVTPPELELPAVESRPTWVQGTELRLSARGLS